MSMLLFKSKAEGSSIRRSWYCKRMVSRKRENQDRTGSKQDKNNNRGSAVRPFAI